MSTEQIIEEAKQSPTYWFLILERAREASDFLTAAEAQKQLDRLGVTVRYGTNRRRKAVAHAC